jgi:uracil-DNA glycosylase family 4
VAIRPGSGWPGDLATAQTPIAATAEDVARLAGNAPSLDHLTARISVCRACPRLVEWREQVAVEKRAAFRDEDYWGRPIAGWGPDRASIAVVGLAPAAHGGNRTGRIFTGDRSGDWLFAALHRAGLARLPTSVSAADGQRLVDVRMLAAVRCAPPANKPTPAERDACAPWLARELAFLHSTLRVVVALGGFAWAALWPALRDAGYAVPPRLPRFGHLRDLVLPGGLLVLGSYHPSQQNTFTGRLTEPMLDAVFTRAREHSAAWH